MATMTVIWWRDIPAQVLARDGRRQSKIVLHPRFQVAIDKAAASPQFGSAIANIGLEPGYLAAADFAKFWDEDAKRSDDAVKSIGRVQG